MNHSFYSADRTTHLKIVVVALVAGIAMAGLLSKALSAATVPAADTRAWDNLPRYLSFAALPLPPGRHEAIIEFKDASGQVVSTFTKVFTLNIPADGRDKVVFVSDRSATPQTL